MRASVARALLALCALCLVVPALLAACTTVTAVRAPSAMKVSIDVKDYHQGTTQVAIHFADASLNTIEFVHGETVTCNRVYLKYDSGFYAQLFGYGAYTGAVPLQPAGGTYKVVYTPASGAAIAVSVPVVDAPVTVAQPASGATVTIPTSAPFIVRFNGSGLANASIIGSAADSRFHYALSFALADTGATSFNAPDLASFAPGPGTITISRITSSTPGGSGFDSLSVSYENITTIQITWA
jgi:hypothetical protein